MIPTLSRRSLLAGAAAAPMLAPVLAAGPAVAASVTAPFRAVHRFNLGAMRVSVIDDARFTFPAPVFAANRPEGTAGAFLSGYGLPADTVSLHMQITLVETAGRKVLLDTGMGDVTFPGNEPDNGRLAAGLSLLGLSPDQITDVVFSHGHPDHIGGCVLDGRPCFPNAVHHIPPQELEFWTQKPGTEESFANFMLAVGNAKLGPVQGLTQSYGDGDVIAPGLRAVAAPGHTVAHHAFVLGDRGNALLHMMDAAVHYLVGPEEPDWALAVEMDPDAAASTRRRLFRMAAEENLLVAGYHFPFPGIGRIVPMGNAWRYVPMQTA